MKNHRNSLSHIVGIGTALALLIAAPFADAAVDVSVVNVRFSQLGTPTLNGTNSSATVAPHSYAGTVWSDLGVVGGAWSVNNLPYSDSALGLSAFGFTANAFNNTQNGMSTPLELLESNARLNGAAMTFTITGLPTAPQYDGQRFDLYLASNGSNNSGGTFTLGSTTLSSDHSQNTTWVAGQNYVVFSLPLDGSGQAVISVVEFATSEGIVINGFQLVEVNASPEPSSVALLALGGLLVFRRRSASFGGQGRRLQ